MPVWSRLLCCSRGDKKSHQVSSSDPLCDSSLVDKSNYLRSTAGLQILLEQEFLRESLKDYITCNWEPKIDEDEIGKYVQLSPRILALNCIEFWADVQDYGEIKKSVFQVYRAFHLFEKYIMHGASHTIPLSTNVIDECTDALSMTTKSFATIFANAESEILDFLIAEVYPSFEKTTFALSMTNGTFESAKAVKQRATMSRRRSSFFKSPDRESLRHIMTKILNEPPYLTIFKTYLISTGSENLLYGLNEIMEIKEKLQCLLNAEEPDSPRMKITEEQAVSGLSPRSKGITLRASGSYPTKECSPPDSSKTSASHTTSSLLGALTYLANGAGTFRGEVASSSGSRDAAVAAEINMETTRVDDAEIQIYFYHINIFYDTYVSLGAPFRLNVEAEVKAELMRGLRKCTNLDIHILDPLEQALFGSLVCDHLNNFLKTNEYRKLVRQGRNSILHIASGMIGPASLEALRQQSLKMLDGTTRVQGARTPATSIAGHGEGHVISETSNTSANSHYSDYSSVVEESDGDPENSLAQLHPDLIEGWHENPGASFLDRVELKNFLHGENADSFGIFMEQQNAARLFNFYQRAWGYQSKRFRNVFEQVVEGTNIFDRYISRNSDEQISITDELRNQIIRNLCQCTPFLFKDACEWTFDIIHASYWIAFKNAVYKKAQATEAISGTPASTVIFGSKWNKKGDLVETEEKNVEETSTSTSTAAAHSSSETAEAAYKRLPLAELAAKYFPKPTKNTDKCRASGDCEAGGNGDNNLSQGPKNKGIDLTRALLYNESNDSLVSGQTSVRTSSLASLITEGAPALLASELDSMALTAPGQAPVTKDIRASGGSNRRQSMLRENCQQFRRRSLNKEPDPMRMACAQLGPSRRNSIGSAGHFLNAETLMAAKLGTAGQSSNNLNQPQHQPTTQYKKNKAHNVLLRNIIAHPNCCSIFKEFLESESSSQTILFIIEVEEYRRITNVAYQRARALKIYNKFLHPLSIMPIPASQETRESVKKNVPIAGPAIFKQATEDVLDYVENCQLPKLLATELESALIHNILAKDSKNSGSSLDFNGGGSSDKQPVSCRRSSVSFKEIEMGESKSLRHILVNQLTTHFFKDFCNRIFVNESLFFYLDAEYYANLPGTGYMMRSAHKICRKYIEDQAVLQINISHSTRINILAEISNPHRQLFKPAQLEIFKLLEQDTLPKFLKSPEYNTMLQAIQVSTSRKKREHWAFSLFG